MASNSTNIKPIKSNLLEELALQGLNPYYLTPPSWRAPWLNSSSTIASTSSSSSSSNVLNNSIGTSNNSNGSITNTIYPQFFPTCEGQEEDQLSESVVKAGYNNPFRGYVTTETFSPHQLIYEKLTKENTLKALTDLATAVIEKGKLRLPDFGPSTFRLPSRVTLNEQKREAWVNDLANPSIPLLKLSKNVPHGYKGEKLLDMIFTRKVLVERAVWYIKAIGAIEIVSQKSRAGFSIAQYTYEWTIVLQDFVKKQLNEIVLPSNSFDPFSSSSNTSNSNLKSNVGGIRNNGKGKANTVNDLGAKSVLRDNELRKIWSLKFTYTLKLLESLYEESLLDRESFLRFLVQSIETTNLAQLPFVLFLTEEYLGEFLSSEPMSARLVEACFIRFREISQTSTSHSTLNETTSILTSLIRSTFISLPSSFIAIPSFSSPSSLSLSNSNQSPTSPTTFSDPTSNSITNLSTLESILLHNPIHSSSTHSSSSSSLNILPLEPALYSTIKLDLLELHSRVEAACEGIRDQNSLEPIELERIQLLDSLHFPLTISNLYKNLSLKRNCIKRRKGLGLGGINSGREGGGEGGEGGEGNQISNSNNNSMREEELKLFFGWSVTKDRFGTYRIYLVAKLIALELENVLLKSNEGNNIHTNIRTDVEAAFIHWIDSGMEGVRVGMEGGGVVKLLEELIRVGAISYSLYLQRMIARGETEDQEGKTPSVHLQLLRSVALGGEPGNSLAKRRAALRKGTTSSNKLESAKLAEVTHKELLALIPALSMDHIEVSEPRNCTLLLESLTNLVQDGSHLLITRYIIPQGVSRLINSSIESSLSGEDHAILTQVYTVVEDFWGLLQYLLIVFKSQPSRELLIHLLDTVESNLDAWTAMGELSNLASALLLSHEALRSAGINERRLVKLLRQLGSAGHLSLQASTQLEQDFQGLVMSLTTSRAKTQGFTGIIELQGLLTDTSPQFIGELATTLWYRYHSYENWGGMVLEGAVQLLSSVSPSIISSLLRGINERLPAGLEPQLSKWISNLNSNNLNNTFGGTFSNSTKTLLLELVDDGTISAIALIDSVVLPVWKGLLLDAVGSNTSFELNPIHSQALDTINSILSHLVGLDQIDDSTSPSSLLQRQRFNSRRMSLFTHSSLPILGRCLAYLVITQEFWTTNEEIEKVVESTKLLNHIGNCSTFQMTVARDPQMLATAILESPTFIGTSSSSSSSLYRPKLLAALLLILKDGSGVATPASLVSTEDWDLFLSGLTIWRLAISKVEVQACLERLDLDDSLQDVEKSEALNELSRHFLNRVCSGEGHTYLGEQVVQCYHGRASDELVSVAFMRLAEAVDGLAITASSELRATSLTTLRCIGRLLNTLLQSGGASSRSEPLHQLLIAVKSCLEEMVDSDLPPQREVLLHSSHLLVIALTCVPSPPVVETWELFKECLIPCAKLAASLSKDRSYESELAFLLLDTCSHLLFGLSKMTPPTSRLAPLHSLLYSEIDVNSLPDTIINRFSSLFGNSTSSLVPHSNPWELVDHTDPGPQKQIRHNTYPIDLHYFDAKVLEAIPLITALDVAMSPSATTVSGTSERGLQTNFDFETPCTGLSLAARGHRRTLTTSRGFCTRYDPNGPVATPTSVSTTGAIASSSNVKKAEAVVATVDQSKVDTGASSSAPRGTKRKEAADVVILDSDSEEEILVKAPPAKRGRKKLKA